MRDGYDTAQICLNGHMVNEEVKTRPGFSQKYCRECGARTIAKCLECDEPIEGAWDTVEEYIALREVPGYCPNCGHPYPWTEGRIRAAKELAEEIEGLSEAKKKALSQSIDDIVRDTPRTELAATKFKKIIIKAGKAGGEALVKSVIQIATEKAKSILLTGQP